MIDDSDGIRIIKHLEFSKNDFINNRLYDFVDEEFLSCEWVE